MSRDGIPRAYLRIDPNIDQVYPELRNTFVGLLCSGHRQPDRGRYRDRRLVEALHSKPFVRRCYDRGDLVDLTDGRVYIDGWDEWQEGDLTVAERMRRMRERRRSKRNGVTDTASRARNDVTTDAYRDNSLRSTSLGVGVGVGDTPPPAKLGRRTDGTNPRALGTNPRANGTSPRQEREAQKHGPTRLAAILAQVTARAEEQAT